MELEINEPFLYIGSSSGAAERFADAIVRTTPKPYRRSRNVRLTMIRPRRLRVLCSSRCPSR
jgi:hypothetical protein